MTSRIAREAAEHAAMRPAPATASLFLVDPLAAAGMLVDLFSTPPPIPAWIARLRQLHGRRPVAA
jgi:hypothetical protein